MARPAGTTLKVCLTAGMILTGTIVTGLASAAELLTLEEAQRRAKSAGPTARPTPATVRGIVSLPATGILDYALLPIQDESGHGLILDVPPGRFDSLSPGDRIEASGVPDRRAACPVLKVTAMQRLSGGPAPAPQKVAPQSLYGPEHQGMLVTTEARIEDTDENFAGEILKLLRKPYLLQVFLPRRGYGSKSGLARLGIGDKIRVTGVAMEYTPELAQPRFQILVHSASAVVLVKRSWPVTPYVVLIVLLSLIGLLGLWWLRWRRLAQLRQAVRAFGEAGESVLGAASAGGILTRLSRQLTRDTTVTGVRLFLLNTDTKMIESVVWEGDPIRHCYPADNGGGFLARSLAETVRNRTLMVFANTARLSSAHQSGTAPLPPALMLVPLLRRGEPAGVLQLNFAAGNQSFAVEEQMAAQHLGNLVASALDRLDQQSIRERLFRTEKLAAVGQLISSVAADLKQPLDTISQAAAAVPRTLDEAAGAVGTIHREAARAAELVARLVTIGQIEQPEVKVVDLQSLLDTIAAYLRPDWDAHSLNVRLHLPGEPVRILGSPSQLEQIFLNLLARAQESSAASTERILSIAMSATSRRVQVEIAFTHDPQQNPGEDNFKQRAAEDSTMLGFGVLRSIVQSHSGEIRLVRAFANSVRYEVELPLHQASSAPAVPPPDAAARPRNALTVLVVEPDEAVRRIMIQSLGARRHRAMPVSNAEEALDLISRVRFDGAFCSLLLPGSHWVEFFGRVKTRLDFFVLMTDAYDEQVNWPSSPCAVFVLRKPPVADEIARLLDAIEATSPKPGG